MFQEPNSPAHEAPALTGGPSGERLHGGCIVGASAARDGGRMTRRYARARLGSGLGAKNESYLNSLYIAEMAFGVK